MSAREPIHVERLLDGTDWRLTKAEQDERAQRAWEQMRAQWYTPRNEREAHQSLVNSTFEPLYNKSESDEDADAPVFTFVSAGEAIARFALCLCAVGLCAAVVTWPRWGALLHRLFN